MKRFVPFTLSAQMRELIAQIVVKGAVNNGQNVKL